MNQSELDNLTSDPIALGKNLFGSTYWDKQEEIIKSVWTNKRTAVKSCNSGGKSRISAEIALLYLLCFRPSRVITTAPTFTQVQEIIWKEIASLYHSAAFPLGGRLNKTDLDLGTVEGLPWQAIGISTNEENRMQGFKSPNLLVIMDEALGIDPIIWKAIHGLNPRRILAIGNPLDPVGDFYKCFSSPLWNTIRINGEDCVKWQNEHGKIDGLIDQEFVNDIATEYGKGSREYIARILGDFPIDSEESVIKRSWVEAARTREIDADEDIDTRVEAWDVASKHGKNETVVCYRFGNNIQSMKGYLQIPLTTTRDMIKMNYLQKALHQSVIDADGMGEGLDDMLTESHVPFLAFHGGYAHKATDDRKYKNLRSQFYCFVAKKFEKGLYSLKNLTEKDYDILKNQLCSINYKPHDGMQRIRIETKEDLKARQIESPDYADAFMMSEYGYWMGRNEDVAPIAWR